MEHEEKQIAGTGSATRNAWPAPTGAPDSGRDARAPGDGPADAYVLLYRGQGLFGAAIRWQTRSRYAHAAVLFPSPDRPSAGWLYEAVGAGVISRWASLYEERADVFAVRGLAVSVALVFLARQVGKRYDWSSVFRFVTRRQASRKSAGVWFCSELVFAALREGGVACLARTEPWEVSPALLARSPLLEAEEE